MRVLSAGELLALWEEGLTLTPTERALMLLGAAAPEISREALGSLTIGQRDAELMRLREQLWGPQMDAVVTCPKCSENLELSLDLKRFVVFSSGEVQQSSFITSGGDKVSLRLPNSSDVMAALSDTAQDPAAVILQRCLLSVERDGAPVAADNLSQDILDQAAECMADADSLADIRVIVTCPQCAHTWKSIFDIISFFWTELEVWASRVLSEVHTLARAYGWSEQQILSLSPLRRQFYLEMAGT